MWEYICILTRKARVLLMDKILHDLKDPKLWELWYIPYYGHAGFCPSTVSLAAASCEDEGSLPEGFQGAKVRG